jgi:predicted NBD/HSP70 family sugar kinase
VPTAPGGTVPAAPGGGGSATPAHGAPPLLRQINSAHVLAALRGAGPLSLSDLAARTGLSRPTVGQVVDQLHAGGLVADVEPGHDGAVRSGRPARLVRFRSEAAYVVGIDIGRNQALVTVADLAGTIVAQHHGVTSGASSSADLLAALRTAATSALGRAGIRRADVASVAAGTPGLVDWPRGAVVLAPQLPGWKIELARELRRSFRCPVQVENDANLAVLAERRHGLARDAHTVVFILWGERVGAGVLIGDQLHRGAANAAGEIGFLALDEGTTAQPDEAGRGPFERLVGAEAIAEVARAAARRRGGALPSFIDAAPGAVTAEAVFAAAARGDPAAVEALRTIAARFSRGLAPVLLVLDPDLVVIGASVSRAGAALLEAIEASVAPLTLVRPRLALSRLGDEAVTLGAVELALAEAERRLLPGPALA